MADDPKPPYVKFEYRELEDRDASIEAGHYVGKDVIFAIVTPAGTRDRIERQVEDWLLNLEEGVKQERIPSFWLSAYRRALEDFKASRETPEFGVPIKDWPSVSKAQVNLLLDINVTTVEQLAEANEETLMRIGMGGRALKEKARAWLESAAETGKVAEEVSALRQENEELKQTISTFEQRMKDLETKLQLAAKEETE